MVRSGLKYSKLGKEGKIAFAEGRRASAASRQKKDDKRWKRVIAKMDADKKKKFAGVGNAGKGRVRGATRRSQRKTTARKPDTVAYEFTVHMKKLIKGRKFASRAPLAVDKLRAFAKKVMKTKDNRIDGGLNTFLWSQGVKGVPHRVRVRVERHVAENTDGASKRKRLYSVISYVPTTSFKGLLNKQVNA